LAAGGRGLVGGVSAWWSHAQVFRVEVQVFNDEELKDREKVGQSFT